MKITHRMHSLELIYKLPIFITSWILFSVFSVAMIVIGWVFIPPAALLHKYTTKTMMSKINGREILVFKYMFLYPWSNDEDGINGGIEYLDKPLWFRIIYWSAVRNPVNNLRFFKILTCQLEPKKIRFITTDPKYFTDTKIMKSSTLTDVSELRQLDDDRYRFISLTWQDFFSNFRAQFIMFGKIYRFWIGWKIYPHDILGISHTDYRFHGGGFALQFKCIYPKESQNGTNLYA